VLTAAVSAVKAPTELLSAPASLRTHVTQPTATLVS
jgi:hypothetical protein